MNAAIQFPAPLATVKNPVRRTSFHLSPTVIVTLYALAMAWVEAAVVFYMRSMINRIVPYQPNPLPIAGGFGFAEVVREAATLVMLLSVGALAGRTWRSRAGYTGRSDRERGQKPDPEPARGANPFDIRQRLTALGIAG